MKRAVLLFLWAWSVAVGATEYDKDKPFGFCTVASRTDASKTFECVQEEGVIPTLFLRVLPEG